MSKVDPAEDGFLLADREESALVVIGLFRCANEGCFVQLRAFRDDHALGGLLAQPR
jgi:hypothetical protein